MPISDYLSSNIIVCIFELTYFRELGQKYKNNFVGFWFKSVFEINWPLDLKTKIVEL